MNQPHSPNNRLCPHCGNRIRFRSDGRVRRHFLSGKKRMRGGLDDDAQCPQGGKRLGDTRVPAKQEILDQWKESSAPPTDSTELTSCSSVPFGPNGECPICGAIPCKDGCADGTDGLF